MSRSLPDVRDGLKPVHRRLLFAMLQLKLSHESAYKKCARVVGDVIGKYHPHGEVAVYDTLVRLAQSFSLRYPLIDGQGNFGSVDGDNAAAMRYTESRLTEIALKLMEDLDKDTVDFKLTYDNSEEEPVLFPAAFPNILANGSEGIAVGMATSIPPHNLHELCDAMLYMLDNEEVEVEKLLDFVKGPDFPTAGTIVSSKNAIAQIYTTGKGSIRLRAKWEKENLTHGTYQIVISEIPYQVQKSKLIEQIADLYKEKKLPLVDGIRDESAEDIRIIIEPKNRQCDAEMIMESLFKQTDLEVRIHVNMNVISSNNVPKVMNLKEILSEFLSHRRNIVIRRSNFLLAKIIHRLEILEGLRIAYLNLDEIIKIIREEDEPKIIMMERFKLTDIQAEAILNMRLRSLRRLEEIEIKTEYEKLSKEKTSLELIISDKKQCIKVIKSEIKSIQDKFGYSTLIGARKTDFVEKEESLASVINIEAFIEREPITIICSKKGWIRSIKGHVTDFSSTKYKEGDEARFTIHCSTTDNILIFTEMGRFYTILADSIYKGKGDGEPFRMMVSMEQEDDIVNIHVSKPNLKILVASTNGRGFVVDSQNIVAQTKMGRQVLNVSKPNKALVSIEVIGDMVATIGNNRKLLIFHLREIPELKKALA
jgi:topoisomerase-4 subunit A